MVALALAGWGAAWAVTGEHRLGLAGVGAGALACLVVARLTRTVLPVALALVVAVLGTTAGLQTHGLRTGPVAQLARHESVVTAEVVVRGDPRLHAASGPRPAYLSVATQVRLLSGRGSTWRLRAPVLVVVSGQATAWWTAQPVGSRIAVQGRLSAPEPGDAVAAVLRVRSPAALQRPPPPSLRAVERVRAGLRDAVASRPAEPRALVPALVLGDTSALTPELTTTFQQTGLTHLTAVSGANLTLLLAFVLTVARWLGVRGWWLRLLGLLGVGVFVALCRTEPSVLRAAAMGLVALAALGSRSRRAGLRNLGVAMLALLIADPHLCRSLGFLLSVLASGGIIVWGRPWSTALCRWLPRVVAEAVAVPLAAHLATLPVVAAISGQVSASGLLANALAGPFVGPATVCGFAAAGVSLVSPTVATWCGAGAAWSAQVIIWVAAAGARLPGTSWRWPATGPALVWLGLVALLAAIAMGWVLRRRWLSLVLAGVMVACLLSAPRQPGWPPDHWVLVACDVGQGDGLVLRVGRHAAVVVDTGPEPAAMERCLDQLAVRSVPLVVLTHFHADHVDGLRAVYTRRTVGQLWVTGVDSPASEAAAVRQLAARHGTPVVTPAVGQEVVVGEAALRVLGPLPHFTGEEDESSVQNDSSLVVLARVAALRLLLTGDVEPPGQQALVAAGTDLRADVLKVPHHGSARQDPDFFAATHARVAIASAGVDNDYGHPAPSTVRLAQSLGMTVLATNEHGGVAVTDRRGELGLVAQR